ncbi:MAG: peptide chain release factor 1, partial [Candidatus Aenigmarchaeota archaeon]|nr:peptide chain release factor 1 [Candidatus Aenigmarchaeota archaeon]
MNIKSKTTRKNVTAALEKAVQELKLYKRTPPNGMALFSGNVSGRVGVRDVKVWVIEPPNPLSIKT